MDLILPLKKRWFNEIKAGRKPFEYRLNNAYWQKRLIGKNYDRVIFTLGYPKRDDDSRRIIKPYHGYEMQTVVSEEWNNEPQDCFAIIVEQKTPVVIRWMPQFSLWYICHAQTYQSAFRASLNGFSDRSDAELFAQRNNCSVELHNSDKLQNQRSIHTFEE